MLRTDYRFWIQREDAEAPTQMYPLNFGACSYKYEKKFNWNFARRIFQGELIFVGSDYDYFKAEYDETDACYQYNLIIEHKCHFSILVETDIWLVDFMGYFSLNKGKFNFERCKYSIEPELSDKYSCILKNIDKKINIIVNDLVLFNTVSYHFSTFDDVTYTRCITLNSVLSYIFYKIGCDYEGIDSDFFQAAINPVTGEANKLKYLMFAQKTDIIYPDADNPATKGEISLGEVFEILYNMFQVKWDIIDDYVTFTHVKDIHASDGLDLTADPYNKTTAYQKELEWDKDKLYQYEKWVFMESANVDFTGEDIKYTDNCSKNTSDNTKEYRVNLITTDLQYIHDIPERISYEGFVMLVTEGDGGDILAEEGILSDTVYPNAHLSVSNLQSAYWRYDRIFRQGDMNNTNTIFLSWQKLKKIKPLTIILCCDIDFDMMDTVTTELGEGEVIDATFYPLSSKLELNIMV